jgi:hypothetical protein
VDVKDTRLASGAVLPGVPKEKMTGGPRLATGGGGARKPPTDKGDLTFSPPRKIPPKPSDNWLDKYIAQEARATYIHNAYGQAVLGHPLRAKKFEFNTGSSLESRVADDYDPITGILTEINTTPWSTMSQAQLSRKLKQAGQDFDLIKRGGIKGAVWYGTEPLPTTGLGGQLAKALQDAHIPYRVVPLPPNLQKLRPPP